jgi:hypothetical protein
MRRDPERCGERWKYDVIAMKRNNFDTMPFDVVTDFSTSFVFVALDFYLVTKWRKSIT